MNANDGHKSEGAADADAGSIARERLEKLREPLALVAAGASVRSVFKRRGSLNEATLWRWIAEHPIIRAAYDVALHARAECHAEDIAAIADERPPKVETQFGAHMDAAFVAWQKNRIDARKWAASKLLPKKYGERTVLAGDADNPIPIDHLDARAALLGGLAPKPAGSGEGGTGGGTDQ